MRFGARIGSTRAWLTAVLAALAIAPFAACGSSSEPGSSGSGSGNAELTVGVQTKILQTYYPQLAQELGYFKQEGLNVKIVETQSPANTIQALIGGSLDLYLGGPEALPAAAKGADVRFIAAGSNRSIWDIVATKDVHALGDLKGKTFGVSATTSISTITARQALARNGVNPDDVKYVVAGGTGARFTALQNGRVQAAALGIPVNYKAAESGLNDLGATDTALGAPPVTGVVLTVSKRWADGHRDKLQRFLRAYQHVIDALYDPAMTDKIVNAAAADMKVDPGHVRRAVQTLFLDKKTGGAVLPRDGHIDVRALQTAADAFSDLGSISGHVDAGKYVDMSYLEAAQRSLKEK
jgi:ABC-type nitrate/sulfonate/bicarbonate transport system substrate-binding protein